jgi:hypothetical protein
MKIALDGGAVSTLASGQNSPSAIAVNSTDLYWINDGNTCAPLGGCTGTTNGSVMALHLSDGTLTVLASGQHSPNSIAIDGASAYWTNYGNCQQDVILSDQPNCPGTVLKVPLGGGSVTTLVPQFMVESGAPGAGSGDGLGPPGALNPDGIAVDESSVYWLDSGGVFKRTPK